MQQSLLHGYLHRELHSSGPFDMHLVYEDMPQESLISVQSGLNLCRMALISANGYPKT